MRFLVRLLSPSSERGPLLDAVRSIARQLGARAVNPKWTSYGALEVDLFVNSEADMGVLAAAIEPLAKQEFVRNLDEPPRFMPRSQIIDEARRYFNAERFWECHETLEQLWRTSEGEEKRLLQGIILVCASFVHRQKDEPGVAINVAKRASALLVWHNTHYEGIEIEPLRSHATEMSNGRFIIFKL